MSQYPPPVPPVGPGPGAGMQPHRGTMILIFGIVGIVCCVIFAILAWVMGSGDLKKIRAGQMDPAGEGLTKGGMICGIIGVCLAIVAIILNLVGALSFIPMMNR